MFLELLFALVELFLELFLEAALEIGAEIVASLFFRGMDSVFDVSEFRNPVLAGLGYVCLGAAFGGLSVVLFPHPFVHPTGLHGISLLLSPILTGLAMSFMGTLWRKRGKAALPIESFGYGFTFAFGMALIRFVFTR